MSIRASTGIMCATAVAAGVCGYNALTHEQPAESLPADFYTEPAMPEQVSENALEAVAKDIWKVLTIQEPVFGLPEEQSDNTMLALEFGVATALIGTLRPERRHSQRQTLHVQGSSVTVRRTNGGVIHIQSATTQDGNRKRSSRRRRSDNVYSSDDGGWSWGGSHGGGFWGGSDGGGGGDCGGGGGGGE